MAWIKMQASVTPLDTAEGQPRGRQLVGLSSVELSWVIKLLVSARGGNHASLCGPGFFQHYKLGKKLGEGAFGQVRLTTRMDSGEMYAVKIMDVRARGYPPSHQVFVEEKPRCYGSLMDSLCDMPKLTEIWLRRMFRQMLLGIGACHNAGIVHRDIKLDNFLYGGMFQDIIKLSDMGLAVKLPRSGYVKGVSGTAPYMSPEMLARKKYNTQTDVWSFASTVYVILYGDVPYSPSQPTAASVKKAIVNAFPPPAWMRNAKLAKHYQQPSSGAETFCRYLPLGRTVRFWAERLKPAPRTSVSPESPEQGHEEESEHVKPAFSRSLGRFVGLIDI
ncbi:CBL-interacting serine/threonine-protein kinase 1 (SNF1-related kinase 3.16) (SOS2-like protein kinase PKS13) [Durusdinium trenchii]|uniref:non-specific serine/threonine protein kinase n=1 Tax=Durusdinium trenchii TaxID=1381693 RepID=A0ABP0NZG9_9DINO